ncbi:GNAT family N-acetyltransferase [Haloglomus litoreum]|uniref:GNAT family N-acetyltransferase n=1 Tax=Haloglomus litoreum TaxID=3034026 RepID=UPI0023E81500|nr:N-acetyltransferase [Haloglomus sp. DT116]
MERDVTIRAARPADVDGIFQVMRQSRRNAFAGLLPPDALDWDPEVSDGFRQFVHETLSADAKALLIALDEDHVLGLVELVWAPEETQDFVEEGEAELSAIHVRPDSWNQGIGTRLLDETLLRLPSQLSGVALCVLSENERARAFYDRRGFDRTGTTVNTYAGEERLEVVYHRTL